MLRTINSGIYKNSEVFQQISDSQAALISGGMELPVASDIVSNVGELTPNLPNLPNLSDLSVPEPLNSVLPSVPIDLNSFVTPLSV